MATDTFSDLARAAGELPAGSFRVVTMDSEARVSTQDFSDFAIAVEYADDAASEPDVLSAIFDAAHTRVHTGRAYFAK